MIALLSSLVMNSPWLALKNFFFTGALLFKTFLMMLKKMLKLLSYVRKVLIAQNQFLT